MIVRAIMAVVPGVRNDVFVNVSETETEIAGNLNVDK